VAGEGLHPGGRGRSCSTQELQDDHRSDQDERRANEPPGGEDEFGRGFDQAICGIDEGAGSLILQLCDRDLDHAANAAVRWRSRHRQTSQVILQRGQLGPDFALGAVLEAARQ